MNFGVPKSAELARILALPRRVQGKLRNAYPFIHRLKRFSRFAPICTSNEFCSICRTGGVLFPIQESMLVEAAEMNGLFAPVGVGQGKTLVTFLLPVVMRSKSCVLFVPAHLREKTEKTWEVLDRHFVLPGGVTLAAYTDLSNVRYADMLEVIQPDLVIADECHHLKNRSATRTKRFLRYMKLHPECRFVALSGTITSKSINDYGHLIELALRKNSPLPIGWRELQDWAEAIDPVPVPRPPGALTALCATGESVRDGFRRRLVESPGVVATTTGSVGCSLTIKRTGAVVCDAMKKALTELRKFWRVGDEEITDVLSFARAAKQLALGFFYRWKWPYGKADENWLSTRADWHRTVRHVLAHRAKPGLDSPMLVTRAARRGELKPEEQQCWDAWMNLELAQPPTETVWLTDGPAQQVADIAWQEPCIVWCEHTAFGEKVAELANLPYYGGGSSSALLQEKSDRSVILSIKAHAEGHDHLSVFNKNLVTSPPSSGKVWEQMLGRTHRLGQQADEVVVQVFMHTTELQKAFDSALESAAYIEETQGNKQKLLYAVRDV